MDWREPATDWREHAACRDQDPDLFFPIGDAGPALQQIDDAKAICHRCPVTEECLRFALATGQDYGIWGGLTADERRALRRHRPSSHPDRRPRMHPAAERTAAEPR